MEMTVIERVLRRRAVPGNGMLQLQTAATIRFVGHKD